MISRAGDLLHIRSARLCDLRLVAFCKLPFKSRRSHAYCTCSKLLPRERFRARRGSKTKYKIDTNGHDRSLKEQWTARRKRPIGARIRLHCVFWGCLRRCGRRVRHEHELGEKKAEVAEAWIDFTCVSTRLVACAAAYSQNAKVVFETYSRV